MYSTGIPIFYFLGFIFLQINFWMFKLLLLRYYRKATLFNEDLALKSIRYLKFGLFIHIVSSLFMLSNPTVFPNSWARDIMKNGQSLGDKDIYDMKRITHSISIS